MRQEDKRILNYLVESYNKRALLESVDTLNELLFTDITQDRSSVQQTAGMKDKGVKGLVKALPSAIISNTIFWPASLIALLGALTVRAERRWLKSVFNNDNWLDYMSRSFKDKWLPDDASKGKKYDSSTLADSSFYTNLSDAEKNQFAKEFAQENTKTYYAVLSNGEILRVRTMSQEDAHKLVDKIIDFVPYNEMEKRLSMGQTVYMVYFTNYEQVIWCAADKEIAKKEALLAKQQAYREILKKTGSYDGNSETLKVEKVQKLKNQAIEIPDKNYILTEQLPLSHRTTMVRTKDTYYDWKQSSTKVFTYKFKNSKYGYSLAFPAKDEKQAIFIAQTLHILVFQICKEFKKNVNSFSSGTHYRWCKVLMEDGDVYIFPTTDDTEDAYRDTALEIRNKKYAAIGGLRAGSKSTDTNLLCDVLKEMDNSDDLPDVEKITVFYDSSSPTSNTGSARKEPEWRNNLQNYDSNLILTSTGVKNLLKISVNDKYLNNAITLDLPF